MVVFRAAPGASREGGVEGGGGTREGRGSGRVDPLSVARSTPLSAAASNVLFCFPDVTPITTRELKSCDSGPTRARSSFPWSLLP